MLPTVLMSWIDAALFQGELHDFDAYAFLVVHLQGLEYRVGTDMGEGLGHFLFHGLERLDLQGERSHGNVSLNIPFNI